MSAAAVFAEILAAGWIGVSDWPKQNKEETLHLEFKRQAELSSPYNDQDRGNLAKAISGFANVEGGVVVFGVHATDMGKKSDIVQSIHSFVDVASVFVKIERDLPNLTDPPVAGLNIKKIVNPANPESGIIIIFVPASDGGPHRVTKGKNDVLDRYYMRTVSSTVNMPHSILSALFGRRPPPVLKLSCTLIWSKPYNTVVIHVHNQGRGHAGALALRVDRGDATAGRHDGLSWEYRSQTPAAEWRMVQSNGEIETGSSILVRSDYQLILQPGMTTSIVTLQLHPDVSKETGSVVIQGEIYAKNSMSVVFNKEIILREIKWDRFDRSTVQIN
jgi:hypothetical protein